MALPHTKTSGAARMAVIYITVGALIDVWTTIWYVWMNRHGTATDAPYFWCLGFFLTGLTLVIIGLALGRIGRSARHAEAPVDTTSSNAAVQAQEPVAAMSALPGAAAPVGAMPANNPARTTTPAPGGAVSAGSPGVFQPR